MPSFRPEHQQVAVELPWKAERPWRSSLIELAADFGRFALVALLLLAVLVTAWWPAQTRRALADTDDRNWLPGGA
jgi:hypothetical protein